jgi:hypothetical protein
MYTMTQTVAIATTKDNQCGHFDQCSAYAIVTVDMQQKHIVKATNLLANTELQPLQRLQAVQAAGAQLVIATQMNGPLQTVCLEQGIPPLLGVTGVLPTIIAAFMNDSLEYGNPPCEPHDAGHQHEPHRH